MINSYYRMQVKSFFLYSNKNIKKYIVLLNNIYIFELSSLT